MAAADKKKKDAKEDVDENDDEKEGQEQNQKEGSKLKLIIILLVVLAVLGAGGAAAYFFLFKAKSDSAEKKTEAPKQQMAVFWPMDPFIVNLVDNEGERYLKVVLQLELSDLLMVEDMKKMNPKLRDNILELLSSKTYKEMMDPLGKQRLRDEIVMRMNLTVNSSKGKVIKVYFTEFIIQ